MSLLRKMLDDLREQIERLEKAHRENPRPELERKIRRLKRLASSS